MSENTPHLLLIGGGHAHVAVLADWIRNGLPARTNLITPSPTLRYSGMVPGWIAGQYDAKDGLVDLAALAERAGAELVLDRCVGIDAEARTATTASGHEMAFDYASIDTGGVGQARKVLGDDPRLLDVRPIDRFVEQLSEWRRQYGDKACRIVVIGGGAGGVELAFALRNASGFDPGPEVVLATGSGGLLPDFSRGLRARVANELAAQNIKLSGVDARIEGGRLLVAGGSLEPADLIVAAVGSGAPDWLNGSGLERREGGFVAVDRVQRSTLYPYVFAVGDVASRIDRNVPHSGVHAVHAGPVLAANLRAVVEGREPTRSYQPRPASLYLLSTGDGCAIASYGPLVAQGRWVARLKRWIDKRWIATYARLSQST
ncbi:MAG: FAD-dependent oxidoreductase [Pseudomonadota bacterium]